VSPVFLALLPTDSQGKKCFIGSNSVDDTAIVRSLASSCDSSDPFVLFRPFPYVTSPFALKRHQLLRPSFSPFSPGSLVAAVVSSTKGFNIRVSSSSQLLSGSRLRSSASTSHHSASSSTKPRPRHSLKTCSALPLNASEIVPVLSQTDMSGVFAAL